MLLLFYFDTGDNRADEVLFFTDGIAININNVPTYLI